MADQPTLQSMATQAAAEAGVDPLVASDNTWVEYAPVDAEGVIWWVYATHDRDSLTVNEGGSVAARVVQERKSAWQVVGPDWRPT